MILPIHVRMPLGRSEKKSTAAKKTAEKISRPRSSVPATASALTENETVAVRGMANSGPMVRYSAHVNASPYPRDTREAISSSPELRDTPSATIPSSGSPTPVTRNPAMAAGLRLPASCPIYTGKIRFPAPKNIPNSIDASAAYCRAVSFFISGPPLRPCRIAPHRNFSSLYRVFAPPARKKHGKAAPRRACARDSFASIKNKKRERAGCRCSIRPPPLLYLKQYSLSTHKNYILMSICAAGGRRWRDGGGSGTMD